MIYLDNTERTLYKPAMANLDPVPAETVRAMLARLLGTADPAGIFLTRGGEQAMELVLSAFVPKGCHVIATGAEREDTLTFLRKLGAEISVLRADVYGRPVYEEMEKLIRPDTAAVICAHSSAATGNVTNLTRICTMAKKHDLPVISDGRCSAGAIDVNLEELETTAYVFTGEGMLMGPRGVGGVCVRGRENRERFEKMTADQQTMPEEIRLAAFAASLQFILDKGIYGISMLPHRLAKRFFESVKAMDPISVWGDYGTNDRLPLVSITIRDLSAEEIQYHLEKQGIRIGVQGEMARFSFGYFNTRAEVKETVMQLMKLLDIDDLYLLP